jgi:Rrf2 family nitric oxide-sensitive transcriptional repressor
MQLTLFSDYALRMLTYLALRRGEIVPISEISERYGISKHYMMKVMNELVQLGYIEAVRGRNGGVRLSKRPSEIRIGKLIRRTEPDRGVLDCVEHPGESDCRIVSACQLRKILGDAQEEFYRVLDRYSLGDLVQRPEPLLRSLRSARG